MDLDLERRSVSSSDSSSAADRIELEAAEALADLAHSAMRESSGIEWGSKGKRARKRVRAESDSVSTCSDLPRQDRAAVDEQPIHRNAVKPAKQELDADVPKSSPSCATSYPSYGTGRSRLNLTEAEKEERRLRRILANRESARQTIRRRQALCEELTRKAADLSWENENLKKEKELALKNYQSLETTNKHLKAQMAKQIKAEMEASPRDLKAAHADIPTTAPTNCPLLLQHETSVIVSGPRTPLYVVTCPWFFPGPDHGNGLHAQPSFSFKQRRDGTSLNNLCRGSSSPKAAAPMENWHSSISIKVKSETASSEEFRVINDLNETPVGLTLDEGGQCEMILTPVPPTSVTPAIAVKNEAGPKSEYAFGANGICTKANQLRYVLPEKNQDPLKFPSKKLVDAASAAEARRRRKELTKLKNLHGRQCRLNC
ncbi:BASIC-LEUCINE ZIPPER (BZIP) TRANSCRIPTION FACTOR FAMILY PROTEIN [Salix koriyanagi]|uniref:BASIC-LEUCINE ZIPPER (BZIP) TRANSCRIPTION FACTOR FAMILY PROTEIN n=1 Tax=Salix koriyanagi TaxID=2511006 RepID=A0A9Q0VFW6_9ROSI|nr:BASIC-LEUCINE ZIPPER (BZIP) TRANSCRIPTION FACTOR FAMILY PROTEIN [Salix koriyanagi]